MVNAINQHHQHNQHLHQQHGLQKQMQQPHCTTPMQAKYDAEEERDEPDHADLSVCVHIVMTVKSEWIHEVKFRKSSPVPNAKGERSTADQVGSHVHSHPADKEMGRGT